MESTTFRPSLSNVRWRTRRALTAVLTSATLPLTGVALIRATRDGASSVWLMVTLAVGTFSLVCIAAGVGEWLYLRNATLFIKSDRVGMTNWRGHITTAPLTQLQCVRLASAPLRGTSSTGPLTTFIAKDGTTIFQFRGKEFSRDDLLRLCNLAGVDLVGAWPRA